MTQLTIPSILFGVVLSSAYGTGFHFLRGASLNKLVYYVALAWLGFWIGHFAGLRYGWGFATVGPLDAGMATIVSLVVLMLGDWLGRIEISRKQ